MLSFADMADIYRCLNTQVVRTAWIPSLYQPNVMGALVLGLAEQPDAITELQTLADSKQWELNLLTQAPTITEPGLLLMDMDSTAIEIECIDEIAKLAGVGEQVAEVTELAMQGKLDFAESLRARVATLTDADESILNAVRTELPMSPGLPELVKKLADNNWRVAIASGGFTYFADYLKETLPLDAAVSNQLEIVDGKLTGKVLGDIIDAQRKASTLLELAEQFGIASSQTVAAGDGANDLVMMDAAAMGVAYHAKPVVAEQASTTIKFHGLEGVFYLLAS
ncbi:phosphoserine phosphatase SerB [Neiella marina]|uniref:Phosphoserine phosphatase n=2 Tax=Neiella holothuriorum TaxID=2870530 RepID=A0ABS7EKE2_9GAMM|nr:phosphoserine phosphatase SerB [Neiella holothuriorum]